MGNESSSQPVLRKPPMLAKQGTGFNSYDYDRSISPKISAKEANQQFAKIVTDTLKRYKTKEFDALIESVEDEIAQQYPDKDQKNDSKEAELPDLKQRLSLPKANLIKDISTTFEYMKQLGTGASCRVLKSRHIQNNKLYAVKELTKKHEINAQLFTEEVKLLRKLHHPNILRYYNCYIDEQCYYIATEFCSGGTMLEKIIKMKSFSERKASQYICIILSAVNYMHDLNIVHRDIKAQNMVFDKEGIDGVLQIIDFGDSKIIQNEQIYSEFVGTIHYVPPEIVRARTGNELKKSDLWSIGVITYLLVCGSPPFRGTSQKEILANIVNKKQKKLLYPKGIRISKSCRNFIESLLCKNINDRLDAAHALKHPWICGGCASTDNLAVDVLKALKRYNYNNKLQDILVNAILSEMDFQDQEILSTGLLNMNRNVSNMDNDSVVNYLLLHSSIQTLPVHDKHWKKRRISEVKLFQHESSKKLQFTSTPEEEDEDDIDAVYIPSKVAVFPVSIGGLNRPKLKDTDSLNVDMILDDLDGIDVDGILDAVDKKEKELETVNSNSNSTSSVKRNFFNRTVQINHTVQISGLQNDSIHDIFCFSDDEIVTDTDDEDVIFLKINKSHSLASTASTEEVKSSKISTERFRAIMKKAEKQYDIENIVHDLDDGTGYIPLNKIASYTKRIKTMHNLFERNNNLVDLSNTMISKSNTM